MLETEIREMLREKADTITRETAAPLPPIRRVTRRRFLNIGGLISAVIVIAVGATTVLGDIGRTGSIEPVRPDPPVTSLRIAEQSTDVAFGFGSVWITTEFSAVRVDAQTLRVTDVHSCPGGLRPLRPIQQVPGSANVLAIGPDAVWVLGHRPSSPCETAPRPTLSTTQTPGSFSMSIGGSFDPKDLEGGWKLVRIDPGTAPLALTDVGGSGSAKAIAASNDFLWIAEGLGERGQVIKVRQRDGRVLARVPFEGVPVSLAVDRGSVFVSIHNAPGVPDEVVRIGEGSSRVEARAAHDTAGNIVARGGIVILASPTESGLTVTGLDPISLERTLPYYQAPKPYFESDIDILDEEVLIADFVFDREFLDVLYHGPVRTTGRLQSIRLEGPVRYVAAGDGAAWVAGNVNGYTVLSRVRL